MVLILICMFLLLMFSHPMSMLLTFGAMVIIIIVSMYMSLGGFWFSYLLMLIIITGLIVIFSYVVSMMPNEYFGMEFFLLALLLFIAILGFENVNLVSDIVSLKGWVIMYNIYSLFMLCVLLILMLTVTWICDFGSGAVLAE
uniref:NADH dehydrogenase subunit 6 n=1 Tax=Loxosceles similis TaxID=321804 RepID=A0A4P8VY69_LOXSM|nr:NADH dehydrogenase subunit 6 [Loxosceles similis]QCS26178.1 NADH dehydrogenase subunit 6 [Loxosceles similis]